MRAIDSPGWFAPTLPAGERRRYHPKVLAETLLRAEQQHVLQMLIWAALSIVAATAIFLSLAVTRSRSALLAHFAGQMAAWGLVIGVVAGVEWPRLQLRDLSGATRLDRLVWMNVGLDIGYVAVGLTVIWCAWLLARRLAGVGAGLGVVVQGLALLALHLQLAASISR
jgi:hypothetical protein